MEGPHAYEYHHCHKGGKKKLAPDVGIQDEMDFLKEFFQMVMEAVRENMDECVYEIAAPFHHVEGDEGNHDEFHHRAGKGENGRQAEGSNTQGIFSDVLQDAGHQGFRFRRHEGKLVLLFQFRNGLLHCGQHARYTFDEFLNSEMKGTKMWTPMR